VSDIAIRVEGLGKEFRIGSRQETYRTLRDTLTDVAAAPVRIARSLTRRNGRRPARETFWALKDVTFEVKRGEVIGIIGRNGAGKSTLLKVLSRITEPTEGFAEIYGRVGSLLEVGTGFHPELSGRENVYLNGAILGMRRTEIDRNFDEIVEFAEVEQFIDTPVKHYSSGMYLRLAFAVAAHLEPEMLLIDEVLAVGDAAFQKKCLGKMEDVAKQGRTVLFVSHNMAAIRNICDRALVLDRGTVRFDGEVVKGIAHYHGSLQTTEEHSAGQQIVFRNLLLNGKPELRIRSGDPMDLSVDLIVNTDPAAASLWCQLQDADGNLILNQRVEHSELFGKFSRGQYQITIRLPALWLNPGGYSLFFKMIVSQTGLSNGRFLSDNYILDVQPDKDRVVVRRGMLNPPVDWSVRRLGNER